MTKPARLVECPTCRGYGAEVDGTYPCGQCKGVGKVKVRKKPGRPPRAGKPASERIEVRVTAAERKAWLRAAGSRSLSDWLRDLANRETKERAT